MMAGVLAHAEEFPIVTTDSTPRMMIPEGTKLPSGAIESRSQISGGAVDGGLLVNGDLFVQGPFVVDGQVLVGNRMGSPLGSATITSQGNRSAEAPAKPAVKWGNSEVHGKLVVHGPVVITGSLYFIGDLALGGTLGAYCGKKLVFFPRGVYPFAQQIDFNCPHS